MRGTLMGMVFAIGGLLLALLGLALTTNGHSEVLLLCGGGVAVSGMSMSLMS